MSIIDIIIILPILFWIGRGFIKGFIMEILSFAVLIGAYYVCRLFAKETVRYLGKVLNFSPQTMNILAHVLLFILVALVLYFTATLISKFVKSIQLNWLNRIGGGAVGLAKGILIVGFFLTVINVLNQKLEFILPSTIRESFLYYRIIDYSSYILSTLKMSEFIDMIPQLPI